MNFKFIVTQGGSSLYVFGLVEIMLKRVLDNLTQKIIKYL